jgi:hypothetical protein
MCIRDRPCVAHQLKIMTILSEIKDILDKLTPDQLAQPAYFVDQENGTSGVVEFFIKAKAKLYYVEEGDPLYTKKEILEDLGYEKYEMEGFEEVIPKGAYYLSL